MERQCVGHFSVQAPHWMQSMRLMAQVFCCRSTVMAPGGQLMEQAPQEMHFWMSISMCPRDLSGYTAGSAGYVVVTGLLNRFLIATEANFIIAISDFLNNKYG